VIERFVAAFLASTLLAGSTGCSCSRSGKHPAEERAATDVEMLGDGSEPRVTLRVARWTGLRYRMTIRATGSLGLPGAPPLIGPTTSVVVTSEVLRGSAEPLIERRHGGTVRLIEERAKLEDVSVTQPGVPPPVLDFWNAALAPFRNTTYLQNVAESAEVTQLNSELVGGVRPPEAVAKAVDGTLEQQRHVPFRLPPSPVGVGARWRFRESLTMNGVRGTQSVEMTLRSIDANQAVVGVAVHQQAARQDVSNPLAPGANAVLESFQGNGSGEVVVDRLTAIVLSGGIFVTTSSTLTSDADGKKNTATLVGASSMQLVATLLHDGPDGGAP
jgi:hypothetical protein